MVEFSPDATGAYYISASGEDIASYRYSNAGVEVRMDDGTARGGDAEGDTFAGRKTIEYVQGGEKAQDSGVPAIEELIISFIFGESVEEAEEIEIPDIEDLFGSAHDDILVGTYGSNWLKGYYGNDVLDGKEGNDGLFGGGGADALIGGAGNDTAMYLNSDEGVEVRLHNGTARGGGAEGDTFAGTDVIEYTDSEGNTLTREVPDIEHLQGSTRADILAGDLRDNRINGDAGDDVLYGGPDGGDDLLAGGTCDDRLYGGKGNDTLEGGPGNDQLWGGPDNDMLDGGEGDDTFFIAAGGGNDAILDFGNGEDKIDLTAFADIQSVEDRCRH